MHKQARYEVSYIDYDEIAIATAQKWLQKELRH